MTGAPAVAAWRRLGPSRIVTIAVFAVFLVVVAEGQQYPPEARLFPTIVGIAGMALALAVFFIHGSEESERAGDAPAAPAGRRRVLLAVAAAPVYAALVWICGFYFASFAALLVLPQLLGYRRIGILTVIAVVGLALIVAIFSWGMEMSLPNGLIGDWFLATFVYDK